MKTLSAKVEVNFSDNDQVMRALEIDPEKNEVAIIKDVQLTWGFETQENTSGSAIILPKVPNQTVKLDLEIEPRSDEGESVTKTINYDLRNVKISIEHGDDRFTGEVSLVPKLLFLDGGAEVEFEVLL